MDRVELFSLQYVFDLNWHLVVKQGAIKLSSLPASRDTAGFWGPGRCYWEVNWAHSGRDAAHSADSARERCPQPGSAGGGCLPGPGPPAAWSRGRWTARCTWCYWSRSREWPFQGWSGPEVNGGSYCFVKRCAHCQEECLRGLSGSCGLGRRRCWVPCSRCSDGGRTRKTRGHREPTGTPAHSLQWTQTSAQTQTHTRMGKKRWFAHKHKT